MEYDKCILVDYENVQDINTDIIDNNVKMLIIVGENQNKIPIDLIQKIQPFGNSIEWLQIKSKGKKNALDFFIVYFLGCFVSTQNHKEYIIYSKDTGYDPLIDFLKNRNVNVRRIVSFKQLNSNGLSNDKIASNDSCGDSFIKINEKLAKMPSNTRPKSRNGLLRHIKTFTKKCDDEIEKIIEEMFIRKIIYEENGRVKYNL
ncbi:MAG: hypothetical protein LBU13_07205 [Synergistaceae bacterium]|jgi:hypothetical protein|nr:hypothetical protein [Synergistaceae bacterium]